MLRVFIMQSIHDREPSSNLPYLAQQHSSCSYEHHIFVACQGQPTGRTGHNLLLSFCMSLTSGLCSVQLHYLRHRPQLDQAHLHFSTAHSIRTCVAKPKKFAPVSN